MVKNTNKLISTGLIALISGYQRFISPLLGPRCRFYPTCSTYAKESLLAFGPAKGFWLTLKRISKCHPFHPGGVDTVGGTHSC